jgi:hypothetical protein
MKGGRDIKGIASGDRRSNRSHLGESEPGTASRAVTACFVSNHITRSNHRELGFIISRLDRGE